MTACGGGGGGDASPTPSLEISGTVAKGRVAKAKVEVYGISNGVMDSQPLASVTSNDTGDYTLQFPGSAGLPYVIVATATSESTELDEVSGLPVALPAGFTLRALYVPTSSNAATISVTPLSEMAAAAAEHANGQLSTGNIAQAQSTIQQLFGFDPTQVAIKASSATDASTNEKALSIVLTAISKMAHEGTQDCNTTADLGSNTQCVVQQLAGSAQLSSIQLTSKNGTDTSAELGQQIAAVLANAQLSGAIDPATVATVTTNLSCGTSSSGCSAATPSTVSAIDAAKNMFAQLKTDLATLFSNDGVTYSSVGAANQEAYKFQQAMENVNLPFNTAVGDLAALGTGIALYEDYKAGRTSDVSRNGDSVPTVKTRYQYTSTYGGTTYSGEWTSSATPFQDGWGHYRSVGCTLYQDSNTTVVATAPSNANYVSCRASAYFTVAETYNADTGVDSYTVSDAGHGFTITPQGNGSYGYSAKARLRTCSDLTSTEFIQGKCTNKSTSSLTLQADGSQPGAFTGTVTANGYAGAWAGSVTVASGSQLPGTVLDMGGGSHYATATHHIDWNSSLSVTGSNAQGYTGMVAGVISNKNAAGTTQGTLSIDNAKLVTTALPYGEPAWSYLASLEAPVSWEVPATGSTIGAKFVGKLTAGSYALDKDGTWGLPTHYALTGDLTDTSASTTVIHGALTVDIAGLSNYSHSTSQTLHGDSSDNYLSATTTFNGSVSVPNRPTLDLTVSASGKSFQPELSTLTAQFKVTEGTAQHMVLNATANLDGQGQIASISLNETTANLALTVFQGAKTVDIRNGTNVIGVIDTSSSLVTYADHSVQSLDLQF